MIKIALAFDNIGDLNRLRGFFQSCATDLKIFLNDHSKDLVEISGVDLDHNSIHVKLSAFTNRFLFVSFSHGKHDSLICNQNPYVSLEVNSTLFKDTFFYTWSCLSSLTLGERLRTVHGCSVYWGYKNKIWAPFGGVYQGIFIQCANRGIEKFIGGMSVQASKDNAIEYYTEQIDDLADIDYALSSKLRFNRDAMDVQGDMQLTITDFHY